jgi:hypothetical protein
MIAQVHLEQDPNPDPQLPPNHHPTIGSPFRWSA